MVDVVDSAGARAGADTPDEARLRRAVPSWVITVGSLIVLLGAWEIFGRLIGAVERRVAPWQAEIAGRDE